MITTVIFDIDGTLYDYKSANAAAMEAIGNYALEQFGWDAETFQKNHKDAYDRLIAATRGTAAGHDRLIRYTMMMEKQGLPLSHAKAMSDLYWKTLLANAKVFPGVKDAFAALRQEGYRIGIGTNMTAYVQYLKLEQFGLLDLVDFIVTSEETENEKPGAAVFERCLERGGCTAEQCVFVGDELKKDVRGAQAVGMHALLFDPKRTYKRTSDDQDDIILFEKYQELVPLIRTFICERDTAYRAGADT